MGRLSLTPKTSLIETVGCRYGSTQPTRYYLLNCISLSGCRSFSLEALRIGTAVAERHQHTEDRARSADAEACSWFLAEETSSSIHDDWPLLKAYAPTLAAAVSDALTRVQRAPSGQDHLSLFGHPLRLPM
jgi:hypothetical protein